MTSLDEMRRELQERYENLKSNNGTIYLSWRDEKCGITKEHKKVLERWKMLQNQLLEPLPKKLQGTYHPAIEIGLAMENAVDIARELSKYPYSHMPYIEEKIEHLNNRLEELVKIGCL